MDVELLDTLMNLVGELVLARNQIVQFTSSEKDNTFIATTQHLNQLTTELQEGVMKTRMQPIGNAWSKLPGSSATCRHRAERKSKSGWKEKKRNSTRPFWRRSRIR